MTGLTNRTHQMCELYKAGSKVKEIAESFGVLNPAVWKALRRGGVLPPYAPRHSSGPGRPIGGGEPGYTERRLKQSARAIAERERKQPPAPEHIVSRDPCFKCGVRGDIGCRHRRAA